MSLLNKRNQQHHKGTCTTTDNVQAIARYYYSLHKLSPFRVSTVLVTQYGHSVDSTTPLKVFPQFLSRRGVVHLQVVEGTCSWLVDGSLGINTV